MAYLLPQGNIYANKLLNGNFLFQQRAGKTAANNGYNFDRWINNFSGTVGTITAASTAYANTMSSQAARLTTAASGTTAVRLVSPNATIQTESLIGQVATLSLKIRKSAGLAAGDFTFQIRTTTTVNDSYANQVSGSVAFTATVTNANITTSFTTVTITGLIPSSARSICADLILVNSPTASQYVEITDVMLNQGSVAAPFSLCHSTAFGEFTALQQFYAEVGNGVLAHFTSTTNITVGVRYPIQMRATPVITLLTTTPSFFNVNAGGTSAGTASTITGAGTTNASGSSFQITGFTGILGQILISQTASLLAFEAEIV